MEHTFIRIAVAIYKQETRSNAGFWCLRKLKRFYAPFFQYIENRESLSNYMDNVHYDPDQIPLWEKWGTETLHSIIDGRQQYLEDRGEIIKAAISYKFVRFDKETYKMCIDHGQSAGFISIWNL